ncbi:MAG: peptide chain release factor N(5)-glutamine methyltransferase [candidate division Zixibacteria bacterium]|nr:peptide chain release factor N(5)-glutamine methyltransferase [candidate division Zixibacteria bacterium]
MSEPLPKYIANQALRLEHVGIESAKAEMEWILCHVLDVDRLNLYLHGQTLLDNTARGRVETIVARRITREPLQFILEEAWFYGRKFYVTPAVMAPTPETEGLCEAALRIIASRELEQPRILDVGVGSGVISVTVAAECAAASVVSLDISEDAIAVARRNAADLGVADRLEFRHSDFFSAVRPDEKFDLVLSNPPYIREVDYDDLPPEVKADPKIAMTSGDDGLTAVRALIAGAPDFLAPGGRLMFEIGLGQSDDIATITENDERYRSLLCIKDLNDIDRIVVLSCDE